MAAADGGRAESLTISVCVALSFAARSSCGRSACTAAGPAFLVASTSSSAALLRTAHPSLSLPTAQAGMHSCCMS